MKKIDEPCELYERHKADQIADKLNSDPEDNWSYYAAPAGENCAYIVVYDEEGFIVGRL